MKREARGADSSLTLDERALRYVASKGTVSVLELFHALWVENPTLSRAEVTDLVWRLSKAGEVKLEDAVVVKSLGQFLKLWERNLWLYGSLAISFATLVVVYGTPAGSPIEALRWVLGSILVLFVPGYVMTEALFPSREIDSIEHFALSIGLSIVLAMLVGLLLNYTPWGIRLTPIMISLIMLTVGLDVIALFRKYSSI
jgi:uncharacterized membrane protein